MVRHPIQIIHTGLSGLLVVLCDDGTMWRRADVGESEWAEIEFIPQTESAYLK